MSASNEPQRWGLPRGSTSSYKVGRTPRLAIVPFLLSPLSGSPKLISGKLMPNSRAFPHPIMASAWLFMQEDGNHPYIFSCVEGALDPRPNIVVDPWTSLSMEGCLLDCAE